jgi:hypothetical protein
MSDDEVLEGFAPCDFFFSKELDCHIVVEKKGLTKTHLLPPLGALSGEEAFAKVSMGWSQMGLHFSIHVDQEADMAVFYPDFRRGDSIELFIDTRQITGAKTTHRFCHHFFFLPERFEGRQAGECTRFRTEDSHPLCKEELLECTIRPTSQGYEATIFIPKEALVGYEPQKGGRLGFTYRINRPGGESQHFAMGGEHSRLDSMPGMWAVLRLT